MFPLDPFNDENVSYLRTKMNVPKCIHIAS